MKETAIKNTWQDSEKAKIKDITKNTLLSWGILTEVQGEIFPTNAYALLTGQLRMQPIIQCGFFKGKDREYFVDRREFDGRLEVTSPGMLLNNVSIKKMMEGYSKPRNPAIANAFAYMKIIEKWGTGIPRIFRECREYGLPDPELIDFDGDFRVNMYRKSLIDKKQVTEVTEKVTEVTEKVTDIEAKILELISDNPAITTSKLADMLSVTRKTISTHIKIMKKNNVIERIGSDRKGYWKIL